LPVDERHPLQPVDVNGINKMAGEWYHLVYNNVYGIRAVVLRLTNTYGLRMRVKDARQTFLGIWIRRLIEGEPILVFGDGKQIRDFNYVDDVVNALLLAAESEDANGQIYNLGADDPINLKDTAELLIKINGEGTYEIVPFPEDRKIIDIGDYYGDYRKIRSTLGWKPVTPLADGLKKTIEFYKKFYMYYWNNKSEQ
jgi:UDP-glucose 4-epimerase